MSQYIVSARKYRPDSFGSLIGQDNIARTLSNSIKRGQLAHAYLFCGPRGVGKTTTARIFAKMINCSDPGPDMEPCGKCESCISFSEGRSYCIHEMDAASNNSVEDIKALLEKVQVPPQVGRYSVYIIDEVHMLSQAAFNAFLKTLEEPPSHAIFILATTEKHKVLPTILSRCQTYDFNRISVSDIVRNLKDIAVKEGVVIDDESLHVIAVKADGAMRDALTIFDQTVAFCGNDIHYADVIQNLGVLDYEYCFRLTDHFLAGDYGSAMLLFDEVLAKGFNALHFVSSLSSHLRDLVVSRTAGLGSLLEFPDSLRQRYSEQASRCTMQFLYDALAITTQCESAYRAAVNPRLHIEFALMKLSFLSARGEVNPKAPAPKAVAETAGQAGNDVKPAPPAPKPVEPAPSVPAPAPSSQATTGDPVRRRRGSKTGSALSINSIMEEKEAVPETQDEGGQGELPTDEALAAGWKKLVEKYAAMPNLSRLASTLAAARTEFLEEEGLRIVRFYVSNAAQKSWIEEKMLRNLESTLRKDVSSLRVNVVVDVVEDTDAGPKAPYMPEEKAKDLIERNNDVAMFVAELGLDVK
ncbi:MAG: DNA polymerase III subunit gamma/tau [Bacteroidales bacterium]|nr:DNA polymerase III subunit gamma/tau [Bacteroidales bacterium]